MEKNNEIRKRCQCALNLDLFRTNVNIVRDTIEELQRSQLPLRPDDINDRLEAIIENIKDIGEGCQIKNENLEEAINIANEIKMEAPRIPLDELRLKVNELDRKITRAIMKCAEYSID